MTLLNAKPACAVTRLRLAIHGVVQGVGFRPFVHRLANDLSLTGSVNNSPQGVFIEVEGARTLLEQFRRRLETEKPIHSFIQSCESVWLDAVGYHNFVITESATSGDKSPFVSPDIATCPDCRAEIFDPANRRYFYPFTICTHCGPRFSIIEALPYDRSNTSMRGFTMCAQCQREYDLPSDRRFHAQPNACPECGPRLQLRDAQGGQVLSGGDRDILGAAADALRDGKIIAVKGVGGFHLMVAAANEEALKLLRLRKHREEKPFALMFPSLAVVRDVCELSAPEEKLLWSSEAPIVLLRRRAALVGSFPAIAHSVAPGNPRLGVMLPYSPLHHLLMHLFGAPVVATSGNVSDEPICIDNAEALERLQGIADLFLLHDRPIVRPVDDSVVTTILGREMVLRRARGYAPLPLPLAVSDHSSVLAVGAHLKNAVALSTAGHVIVSQHIGDLETEPAHRAFHRTIADLQNLYDTRPTVIAADLHPDYVSTRFAATQSIRLVQVQHHIAHVLSCLAENDVALPALGVAWDGTGFGNDGTIWGGEFFLVTDDDVRRVASLRPFRLPGGDAASREPRRAALGLLHELGNANEGSMALLREKVAGLFASAELGVLETALIRRVNSPSCSSIGRLFDAVAALVGLRKQSVFEGQAAMELEFALDGIATDEAYNFSIDHCEPPMRLDWAPMIMAITEDLRAGVFIGEISARFHNALVEAIIGVARQTGCPRVALSGGCFQNRYLTERTVKRLRVEGFQPYWHQRVPPNDGGIALGQIVAARRELARSGPHCVQPRRQVTKQTAN